jgi:hypothetical protein
MIFDPAVAMIFDPAIAMIFDPASNNKFDHQRHSTSMSRFFDLCGAEDFARHTSTTRSRRFRDFSDR